MSYNIINAILNEKDLVSLVTRLCNVKVLTGHSPSLIISSASWVDLGFYHGNIMFGQQR